MITMMTIMTINEPPHMHDDVTYLCVYDDVTYVYDDVISLYDDVTYVYTRVPEFDFKREQL